MHPRVVVDDAAGEADPAVSLLTVRPMLCSDFALRVAYFHQASADHLAVLGVDRGRLPDPDEWLTRFAADLELPLERRTEYGVVWESAGAAIGFGTADRIQFGEQAYMHLHIVEPMNRARGLGTPFVRLTARHYCEALQLKRLYCEPNAFNTAPNRTLQSVGFRYVRTRRCRPASINTFQTTTVWCYEP